MRKAVDDGCFTVQATEFCITAYMYNCLLTYVCPEFEGAQ